MTEACDRGIALFGVTRTGSDARAQVVWRAADPDVYYVDKLPINVDVGFYARRPAALLITTIATIYPAVAASRLRRSRHPLRVRQPWRRTSHHRRSEEELSAHGRTLDV